jgi:hypothetical protein
MREITSMSELMAELESCNYNYYGLRGAYESDLEKLDRGYLDCSYVWEDGEQTDEQLNGTCALGVNDCMSESAIMERYERALAMYSESGTVLLIADKNQEYGNDEDEVILGSNGYGADVVAIVRL